MRACDHGGGCEGNEPGATLRSVGLGMELEMNTMGQCILLVSALRRHAL